MDKIYIDTDVILDFLLDRQPYSEFASNLFLMKEQEQIKLYTSGLVLSKCYYLLRRLAPHRSVMQKLKSLSSMLEILPITQRVIHDAMDSRFNDFEDAIQNATAAHGGMKILLTRNTRDYRTSD